MGFSATFDPSEDIIGLIPYISGDTNLGFVGTLAKPIAVDAYMPVGLGLWLIIIACDGLINTPLQNLYNRLFTKNPEYGLLSFINVNGLSINEVLNMIRDFFKGMGTELYEMHFNIISDRRRWLIEKLQKKYRKKLTTGYLTGQQIDNCVGNISYPHVYSDIDVNNQKISGDKLVFWKKFGRQAWLESHKLDCIKDTVDKTDFAKKIQQDTQRANIIEDTADPIARSDQDVFSTNDTQEEIKKPWINQEYVDNGQNRESRLYDNSFGVENVEDEKPVNGGNRKTYKRRK